MIVFLAQVGLIVCVVVVYFHQPSSAHRQRVLILVGLRGYVDAVFLDSNRFRKEIQAKVFVVDNQFDRHLTWCPSEPDVFAEHESQSVAHESQVVVSCSHQGPVSAGAHSQNGTACIQFDFVRFLLEACPCVVASPANAHGLG